MKNDKSRQALRKAQRKAHSINRDHKRVGFDPHDLITYANEVENDTTRCLRVLFERRAQTGGLYWVGEEGLREHVEFLNSCEHGSHPEATDEENSAAALGYLLALDAKACGIEFETYVEMYDAGEVSLSHYGSATTPPVKPGNGLGPAPQTLCLQTDGGSSAG